MPRAKGPGPSIKRPRQYEALRDQGRRIGVGPP